LALAIARCSVLSFFLVPSSDPVDNILFRPKLRLLEVGEGAGEPRLISMECFLESGGGVEGSLVLASPYSCYKSK